MSEDTDNWILRNAHLFNVEDKDLLHAWDQLRRMIFDYCHDNHNEQESFMDVSGKQILKKDKDYNAYKTEAELLPKSDSITDTARQKIQWVDAQCSLRTIQIFDQIPGYYYTYRNEEKNGLVSAFDWNFGVLFPRGYFTENDRYIEGQYVLLHDVHTALNQRHNFDKALRPNARKEVLARVREILVNKENTQNLDLLRQAQLLEPFVDNSVKMNSLTNLIPNIERIHTTFSRWTENQAKNFSQPRLTKIEAEKTPSLKRG